MMKQRAALRPYLHGLEQVIKEAYPRKKNAPALIRYADDFVRHEARIEHDV